MERGFITWLFILLGFTFYFSSFGVEIFFSLKYFYSWKKLERDYIIFSFLKKKSFEIIRSISQLSKSKVDHLVEKIKVKLIIYNEQKGKFLGRERNLSFCSLTISFSLIFSTNSSMSSSFPTIMRSSMYHVLLLFFSFCLLKNL